MQRSMRFLGLCLCVMGTGLGTAFAQDQGGSSNRWGAHDPATTADTGLYVGAGYVRAQINNVFGTTGYGFKIDDNAWKAIVGFRPIPPFAVEANYVDLGHQSQALLGGNNPSGHADARAFDIFAVGLLPLGPVDIFGKAGGARWSLSGNLQESNSTLFALDRSGTSFAWGAGVQAHVGPIGGRLEYEHFDMPYTDGARLFSVDVTFTF
jgi:OmpA-like transmembrane domain